MHVCMYAALTSATTEHYDQCKWQQLRSHPHTLFSHNDIVGQALHTQSYTHTHTHTHVYTQSKIRRVWKKFIVQMWINRERVIRLYIWSNTTQAADTVCLCVLQKYTIIYCRATHKHTLWTRTNTHVWNVLQCTLKIVQKESLMWWYFQVLGAAL